MLKMKDGVHWVDLPKELQPTLPAPGTTVEYKFNEKFKDYQKGDKTREVYRHEIVLPPLFTVRHKGGVATLGLVGGYDERGNPYPGEVGQLSFKPQSLGGVLYVHPDQSDEQLGLFMALELHPLVGGNSNPDENITKVMRKIDSVSEAQYRRNARDAKRKADNLATGLKSGEELNRAALLLGIDGKRAEDIVRDDIEQSASNNPEMFLAKLTDKDAGIKAEFRSAINNKLLAIDVAGLAVRWYDNKAMILALSNRTDIESASEEFAAFVNNEDNGRAIYKQIQTAAKALAKAAGS